MIENNSFPFQVYSAEQNDRLRFQNTKRLSKIRYRKKCVSSVFSLKVFNILNKIHLKECPPTILQYTPPDIYTLIKYLLKNITEKYILSMHLSNQYFLGVHNVPGLCKEVALYSFH